MRSRSSVRHTYVSLAIGLGAAIHASPASSHDGVHLELLDRYQPADVAFDEGVSEIVAYDEANEELYVVNAKGARLDILSISDPTNVVSVGELDVSGFGAAANSVAVRDGIVAIAVEADVKQDPGSIVFFDTAGNFLNQVSVGALPDMVTFSPDGRWVVAACEGEPSDDYSVDPEGSIAVIDLALGADQATVRIADFHAWNDRPLPPTVRAYGPGANAARDFEPEYVAVSADSRLAWVTLQENNAIATVNLRQGKVVDVTGLGWKDHSRARNALDASDRDGAIRFATWPVHGMYLPDSIATFSVLGVPLLVMANEGDSRAYDGYDEESRVGDEVLDPTAFPDAATLQDDANLGRLKITTSQGDIDGDGDFDRLYSLGARSISIRTTWGALVWDSGSAIERLVARVAPEHFNASNDNNTFDNRSDDKGPEPEGIAVGRVGWRQYVFVGLERMGGIVTFDVTNPLAPRIVDYVNPRDFTKDPEADITEVGDVGPEGLLFIPASSSPTGEPLLVVGNEISGTTSVFAVVSGP
ncbi:MAG: choice-of-anchor I family protein [Deltaproteobacteria bacterium]|nr:choice-of-anchor I family protein [Deltaproteobacteria bacterium]